ncbi:MAG: hypothetical protein HY343_09375 [Lentisphaerae bacterium]|nr:hypothetical protein [Lentisphaerota bacterium]
MRSEKTMIEQYLEDLEKRIDPGVEEELLFQWTRFLDGKLQTGFFAPSRRKPSPPAVDWPKVSINEALDDMDRMAIQQLAACSDALAQGTGAILNVRSNYGTGILPSLFGAEMFIMDVQLNTLPTSIPLAGGLDAVRRLLKAGIPDLHTGYGDRCFAMAKRFTALFTGYPKIAKYVHIYHPDLQGPMDACELLLGSAMFVHLIDEPALVKVFLDLITRTYARFMREWQRIVPPRDGYAAHWGMLHKGRLMLRDDSAMNLSPEMFDEFIEPYDRRLLSEFGGGAIHFCGRGDHYIDRLHKIAGLSAVSLSQPEYNDMERVFRNTIDKGIMLLGFRRDAAEAALKQGRNLRGRVHA